MLRHSQLAGIAASVYESPWTATVLLDVHYRVDVRPDETIVALPGTHPQEALDWLRDLDFWPAFVRGIGLCHSGFGKGAAAAWDEMRRPLPADRPVTFTGHSLGGALALALGSLHAYWRPAVPFRVVTFGAPRVGFLNPLLRLRKAQEIAMYRRLGDVVPGLPFPPWYRNGGKLRWLGPLNFDPLSAHAIAAYAASLAAMGQ